MAEALAVASGVAGIIALALEVSQLGYKYAHAVVDGPRTQRLYLQEILALTEVLCRLDNAMTDSESFPLVGSRPNALSAKVVNDCHAQLEIHHSQLEKNVSRLAWPFHERATKRAIDELQRFRSVFVDILAANTSLVTTYTLRSVNALREDQKRNQLYDRLGCHTKTIKQPPPYLAGTGTWLQDNEVYQKWLNRDFGGILWCYGLPGVGKSCLASAVIHDLSRRFTTNKSHLLYYFADYKACKGQTDKSILLSLLGQMIKQANTNELDWLEENQHLISEDLSASDIVDLLQCMHSKCGVDIYIVVDALDELELCRKVGVRLENLCCASGFFLYVTSRDHPDLRNTFRRHQKTKFSAHAKDLDLYIRNRFEENGFSSTGDALDHVVKTVTRKAAHVFLMAKLIVDQLLELPTLKKIKRAVDQIPTNLEDAFKSSVERIDSQPKEWKELAYRLIEWIVHTCRPLSVSEVLHAFAAERGDQEIDPDNMVSLSNILRITAGLVTVEPEGEILSMVHMSAHEFFLARESRASEVHNDIAETCLTYLSLLQMQTGPCNDFDGMEKRFKELPFLRYASEYWGFHVKEVISKNLVNELIHGLLDNNGARAASFQALLFKNPVRNRDLALKTLESLPSEPSKLHVAAYWGLTDIVVSLLADGEDVDGRDSQNISPLHWAASNGHNTVINALLQAGADVNAADSQGWTPIFWPSLTNDVKCFEILLAGGAHVTCVDVHCWTPLHWALSAGSATIVKALAETTSQAIEYDGTRIVGAEDTVSGKQSKHTEYPTFLEIAASINAVDLFDQILKKQYSSDSDGWYELWASGNLDPPAGNLWRTMNKAEMLHGTEGIIVLPWENFRKKAWNDRKDWKVRLLHAAIRDDRFDIARLLIEIGADVNWRRSRTALHVAALRSNPAYVELLIKNGSDVSLLDGYGQTALHQAVINGFDQTVETLLKAGSDPNATRAERECSKYIRLNDEWGSCYGQTPLMLACGLETETEESQHARDRILDILIQHGADLTARDEDGKTSLHYACLAGHLGLASISIEKGVDICKPDVSSITALHSAVRIGNPRLIALLVEHGADISAVDKYGMTCVHHLAASDQQNVSKDDWRCLLKLLEIESGSASLDIEVDMKDARGHWTSENALLKHTALSLAIEKRNWPLFDLLLEKDAKLPTIFSPLLEHAMLEWRTDVMIFLVGKGATLAGGTPETRWQQTVHSLVEGALRTLIDSPLLSSRMSIFDLILQILIPIGLDIDADKAESQRCSIITYAASRSNSSELSKILIRNWADPFRTTCGLDAFSTALLHGNLRYLTGLLAYARDRAIPCHWVSYVDSTAEEDVTVEMVCRALKQSGQLQKLSEADSDTVLRKAINAGNCDLVEQLILQGSDIEQQDEFGWRPLHWAVVKMRPNLVEMLIEKGKADVSAMTSKWAVEHSPRPSFVYLNQDWCGSALHLAVLMGNKETVTRLLDHGADPNTLCKYWAGQASALGLVFGHRQVYGTTPEGLGSQRLEIARMLLKHGAKVDENVRAWLQLEDFHAHFKGSGFEDVWESVKGKSYPSNVIRVEVLPSQQE